MDNKTTWLLTGAIVAIFAVIGIGYATSQTSKQPITATTQPEPLPSKQALGDLLLKEQMSISAALTAQIANVNSLYTTEREQLYDKGQWYGAILQYKGTDSANRDTLRIVMHKQSGQWTVKTTPPQPLVSSIDLPDAPKAMLDDINRPAILLGTDTSPTINPGE